MELNSVHLGNNKQQKLRATNDLNCNTPDLNLLQQNIYRDLGLAFAKLQNQCFIIQSQITKLCDNWSSQEHDLTQELARYPDWEESCHDSNTNWGSSIELHVAINEKWVVSTNDKWAVSIWVDRRTEERIKFETSIKIKLQAALRGKVELLNEAANSGWTTDVESWKNDYEQRLPEEILEQTESFFAFDLPKRDLLTLFKAPASGEPILDNLISELKIEFQLYSTWLSHLEGDIENGQYNIKPLKEMEDYISKLSAKLHSQLYMF